MGKARIVIKDGIKYQNPGRIALMDPKFENEIKVRIEVALKAILAETEYEKTDGNPPTFGVEKDTI